VRRVFLADGDALVLPTRRLLNVLDAIRSHLPAVRRVSSYCLPRNLRRKSVEELRELAAAGLSIAYVGAESGDDEVLERVNKGETFASTLDALNKLGAAGITRSVMILNGLAGPDLSLRHADHSARLLNATQPEYLATLVVSFPLGEERFRGGFPGWRPLSQHELFVEMEHFLDGLELERTVFRSDHASNWLILKGTLGADKERLLRQVRDAIANPDTAASAAGVGARAVMDDRLPALRRTDRPGRRAADHRRCRHRRRLRPARFSWSAGFLGGLPGARTCPHRLRADRQSGRLRSAAAPRLGFLRASAAISTATRCRTKVSRSCAGSAKRLPHGAFVFTSNVDGQFQKAGFAEDRVSECHGSIHHLQCLDGCHDGIWPADDFDPELDEEQCLLTLGISALPALPGNCPTRTF
jgi:hypothetical protein